MDSFVVLSLLLALLMLGSATAHRDNLIRINLVRQRPRRDEYIFKHQFATDKDQIHPNRMNMIRYNGFNYIGEIKVGQPARDFRVLLDSGSGELWLPSSNCNDVDKTIIATYNQKQSTSFRDDGRRVNLRYVNGVVVSGQLGREFVQFGDLAIKNQTFIRIESISDGRILQYFHVDGILGLNFASTAGYDDVEAPIHQILRTANLKSNGRSKSVMSLSLNHGKDDHKAGELIIGGLDESLYVGEISWTPLMRTKHWQFRIDSFELNFLDENRQPVINELDVCPHGCDAMADTGTMVITGNPKDIQALNERIGAYHIGGGNFALPSCNDLDAKLPHLSISISGRKFSLTPSQYTFEANGVCFSSFKAMNSRLRHWILGNMFIGHFYTILDFDNERFGLAESPYKSELNIADDKLEKPQVKFNIYNVHNEKQTKLSRVNLIRHGSTNYIAEIEVGYPAKSFKVLLDSSSGDLWLPAKDCPDIDSRISPTYNSTSSLSHSKDSQQVKLTFGNRIEIAGELVRDEVRLGEILMKQLAFVSTTSISDISGLTLANVDGVMGLNFHSNSPLYKLMQTMGSRGLSKLIMSFSLNHGNDASRAGEMVLGGIDESLYTGDITWVPVDSGGNWQIAVDSIELRYAYDHPSTSHTDPLVAVVCPDGCNAILDTGTTLIGGDEYDIRLLNEKIGARHVGNGNYILDDCKNINERLPWLVVTISGRQFLLSPKQYTWAISDGECRTSFVPVARNVHTWVLGDHFMGNFYTIFDFETRRIGLANSKFKREENTWRRG